MPKRRQLIIENGKRTLHDERKSSNAGRQSWSEKGSVNVRKKIFLVARPSFASGRRKSSVKRPKSQSSSVENTQRLKLNARGKPKPSSNDRKRPRKSPGARKRQSSNDDKRPKRHDDDKRKPRLRLKQNV